LTVGVRSTAADAMTVALRRFAGQLRQSYASTK